MQRLACLILLAVAACSGKETYQINEVVKKSGVVSLRAVELNDKVGRKKYDVLVQVRNLHKESIVFFLAEMSCSKGKTEGRLGHAFFGAGERSIDFKPRQMKEFRFLCTLPEKVPAGQFKITINRVFENPNNDGKTTGKLLAENLALQIRVKRGK